MQRAAQRKNFQLSDVADQVALDIEHDNGVLFVLHRRQIRSDQILQRLGFTVASKQTARHSLNWYRPSANFAANSQNFIPALISRRSSSTKENKGVNFNGKRYSPTISCKAVVRRWSR